MIKSIRKILITIGILIGVKWVYDTNVNLSFTRYSLSFKTLPESFQGFKIAHISDFHNSNNHNIKDLMIRGLNREQPNIIVITGDLIDSRKTDFETALSLIKELIKIAPCYYVTGNHESRINEASFHFFEDELKEMGVVVLRDQKAFISQDDRYIEIIGIDDPYFQVTQNDHTKMISTEKINQLASDDEFSILLSHRPEYYELYKNTNVNLVLSGHAHGGQFRLPYVGGLFAPNQGVFPKYDGGVFQENEFAMVVSRGVGNSLFPIRLNNQPEVIIIELLVE